MRVRKYLNLYRHGRAIMPGHSFHDTWEEAKAIGAAAPHYTETIPVEFDDEGEETPVGDPPA